MIRKFHLALVVALLIAACGGGATATTVADGSATTTAAPSDTTTTVEASDDGGGGSVGLDDIPQECVDAFVAFLQDIEPALEGIDWANVSGADLEEISTQIDPFTAAYEDSLADAGCDELDVEVDATDEETFDFLIGLAEDEAPGTVGYLEWIRDFAGAVGQEASGDCDTDIAALEAVIAAGGTMQDLPLAEVTYVGNLMTSVQLNCSAEQAAEFFSRADVLAFLGSG